MTPPANTLSAQDLEDLRWAHRHLEHPSFAARLSSLVGSPIGQGLRLLPKHWYRRVIRSAEVSVQRVLDIAIVSLNQQPRIKASNGLYRMMAVGSGAVGGFLGPVALSAEIPVTTLLMLRSIADIARSQGEDLGQREARLACVEVFALGGRTHDDDATELGYYGLRTTLGLHFASFHGYAEGAGVPGGINLIRAIASRFGVVISDKAATQMVPVAGAVSGAFLNLIFIQHFQDVARGHFIVRRLERQYGSDEIRAAYEALTEEEIEAEKEFSFLEGW